MRGESIVYGKQQMSTLLLLTVARPEASLGGDATRMPADASMRCALLVSFSTAAAAAAAAASPAATSDG